MTPISDDWYVLYGGESEDGRGVPRYVGRTYSAIEAYRFYRDHILKAGPYALGSVDRYSEENGCQSNVSESFLREMARKQELRFDGRKNIANLMGKKVLPTPKPDDWGGFA